MSAAVGNRAAAGVGRTVLGQDRADFADDVADGAPADLKQFGEGVLGAQFALVEHCRQDPFVVGDLLGEHASAGAGQAFPAAASVAVSLVAGGLDVRTRAVIAASSGRDMPVRAGSASRLDTRERGGSGWSLETNSVSALAVGNRSVVAVIVRCCSLSSWRVSAIAAPWSLR